MALPPPGPERDRELARRPRYRRRTAAPVADLVQSLLSGEAAARMRRFARVATAMNRVLDERTRARVRPVTLAAGVLTMEVTDGTLLAELRQHRDHELRAALVAAGAGVERIVWRVRKSKPGHGRR